MLKTLSYANRLRTFHSIKRFYSVESATITQTLPFTSIPGPKPLPLLGNILDFAKYPGKSHELFDKWHHQYGDIVKFHLLNEPWIILFDPQDIKMVFHENASSPIRTNVDCWIQYRKDNSLPWGVSQITGEEWRRHRQVVNELLKPQIVRQYVSRVDHVGNDLVKYIEQTADENQMMDLKNVSTHYAFEAICSILLGTRLGLLDKTKTIDPEIQTFIDSVINMFVTSEKLLFGLPIWKFIKTKVYKEHEKCWHEIFRIAKKLINDKNGDFYKNMDGQENFISIVQSKNILNKIENETTCVELVAAGVDTTANAFQWLMYHIASHPKEQEELYQELKKEMGDSKQVTQQVLDKCKLLKYTVAEAIRLTPVTPSNVRIIPYDISIKGYHIPANTKIQMSVYTPSRSEKNYENAPQFCPMRHAKAGERNSYASRTFGAGARMCPGKRIAEMELYVALAKIITNYRLEFRGDSIPPPKTKMLMAPDFTKSEIYIHKRE